MRAQGTMSGTSMDGVDAAILETDGERIEAFGPTAYRPYAEAERAAIRAALGRWPGEAGVAAAARAVEAAHVEALAGLGEAEVAGFHGQTLAHEPRGRGTHQAGDGGRLADALGRPVAWDFRSADVAAGGEGAPLAPAFHHACARWIGAQAPLAIVNLGGVGNLTWIDPARDMAEPGALVAFDTGPANAPLDDLARRATGADHDADGALALAGRARGDLVDALMGHPHFARRPPKSLDRDAFRAAGAAIDALPPEDAAATWVAVIAASLRHALTLCPTGPTRLLVTGGGRRNPAIMAALAGLPCEVAPVEAAGLDGDMLEAQAFAFLATRVLRGLPISFPGTTGVPRPMPGGRVADPQPGAGHVEEARVAVPRRA